MYDDLKELGLPIEIYEAIDEYGSHKWEDEWR